MSRILPFRTEVEVRADSPRVVDLDGDDAEAVFNALSSDTAREIYRVLYQDPATASEIAETVGTSVQNVRYHIENLQSAGLIDHVDTWYSSRGNEMAVYAATDGALIVSGDESNVTELRSAIERLLGAVVILVAAAAAFQWYIADYFTETVTTEVGPGSNDFDELSGIEPTGSEAPVITDHPSTIQESVEIVLGDILVLSPAALIVFGGAVTLLAIGALTYLGPLLRADR